MSEQAVKISISCEKSSATNSITAFRVRLCKLVEDFAKETKQTSFEVRVLYGMSEAHGPLGDNTVEQRARICNPPENTSSATPELYIPVEPSFTIDRLVLPPMVLREIQAAIKKIDDQNFLYEQWGLKEIDRHPRSAINLYGPPGTGKTATAHAMAALLNKKIIVASYADIESKYHGEGPKNVQTLFSCAKKHDAVIFIDEADSLLSQRLANVTQGSEQAINSMRSQLLICMELHSGLIIFATNFAKNYDKAFDTRLVHIHIPLPGYSERLQILKKHIPSRMPLSRNFSYESIAEIDGVCGRDIKNAVIDAAAQARLDGKDSITSDLIKDCLIKALESRKKLRGKDLTSQEKADLEKTLAGKLGTIDRQE